MMKDKKYKKHSTVIGEIIMTPFSTLLFVAIPTLIVFIVVLFAFGLLCGCVDSLGNAVDAFFTSLPFWNEKWEYAWTLYFSLIISGIVELIGTVMGIGRVLYTYKHPVQKIETVKQDAVYIDPLDPWGGESMSTEEKDKWLREHYPEYYGHAPNPTFADLQRENEAKYEKEKMQREQWEIKQKLGNISDTLDKIHRGY